MPAATSKPVDDIDNYDANLSDDPFATPSPPSKKRKSPSGDDALGLDAEINVQKRVRAPTKKLDETLLLSSAGIPKLRSRAKHLKLKGKGHEWGDANRLLVFYQNWLDDLYPKAQFLDALGMVEKLGHKKLVAGQRGEWILEGKRKERGDDDDGEMQTIEELDAQVNPTSRAKTPAEDRGVPDDADLYEATPSRQRTVPVVNEPDEEDLDALMAESATQDKPTRVLPSRPHEEPDGDDLDALMAETESHDAGGKAPNASTQKEQNHDEDEAAMLEMEGW